MRDDERLNERFRERLEQLDRDKALDWMLTSVVSRCSLRVSAIDCRALRPVER